MNKSSLRIVDQKPDAEFAEEPRRTAGSGGRVAVVTLGCAKNQVDSEVILGILQKNGFIIVPEVEGADHVVVNTCGFLESAVKESIDCILAIAEMKKTGSLKRLVVAGCVVSRYGDQLRPLLPEVDEFLTTDQINQAADVLRGTEVSPAQAPFLYDDTMPRVLSTAGHTAYVKIAEGCSRPCAFCIIPQIRGAMRSRSSGSVLDEIRMLGEQGVREVNLIGQDLTAYGKDSRDVGLTGLLRAIDAQRSVPWVRLLYAYPVGINDELLSAIVELPTICEYLDVPLQHASERVLKAMKRPMGRLAPRRLVEDIAARYPSLHLRTTFIVGFPGETEEDFRVLEAFVAEGHFSSVGVFTFSPEEGTEAAKLPEQVPRKVMRERRQRLMVCQQKVLKRRYAQLKGAAAEVLIEGPHQESDLLLAARTRHQAPEVDGVVIINAADVEPEALQPGAIGRVEITGSAGYDLIATVKEII